MCNALTLKGDTCKNSCATRYCYRHSSLYEDEINKNLEMITKLKSDIKIATESQDESSKKLKECTDQLKESQKEFQFFKNAYVSLQKLNTTRIREASDALAENEKLKEIIAELKNKINLLENPDTKSQAKPLPVVKVSYVAKPTNEIKSLEKQVNRLETELAELKKINENMKPDYDKYQIIKSHESLHAEYNSRGVSFHERPAIYHDLRKTRNIVAHPAAE